MILPSNFASALGEAEATGRLGTVAGRLIYEDVVVSTNDLAATLVERGAPDGTTILAFRRLFILARTPDA